jgi:hypothetical protein
MQPANLRRPALSDVGPGRGILTAQSPLSSSLDSRATRVNAVTAGLRFRLLIDAVSGVARDSSPRPIA